MNLSTKRLVIIAILFVAAIVASLVARQFLTFYVTGSSPRNGSTIANSTPSAEIKFNKKLKIDQDLYKTTITSPSGKQVYRDMRVEGNKIIINFASLDINQEYVIVFNKILSADNKELSLSYRFRTEYKEFGELPKSAQEKEIANVDSGNDEDPILSVIPYSTLSYEINPVYKTSDEGEGFVSVDIKIILTNGDRGVENASRAKYKAEALKYLQDKGIDLTKYLVTYSEESSISGR